MSRALSLTTDPIPQLTWRIAIPASVGMFFNTMYNFVDTYCAGLLSTDALAALSLSFPVFFVVIASGSGLSQGATALIANALGAGQREDARRIFAQSLVLTVLVGAGLMFAGGALLWALREPAMRLFTKDDTVIHHGANYLSIAAFTLAAYPILFVTVFTMQGLKRPTYGLWMGLYRQIAAPLLVFHTLAFTLGFGLWGVWWGIGLVTWSAALFALWWGWRAVRPAESA